MISSYPLLPVTQENSPSLAICLEAPSPIPFQGVRWNWSLAGRRPFKQKKHLSLERRATTQQEMPCTCHTQMSLLINLVRWAAAAAAVPCPLWPFSPLHLRGDRWAGDTCHAGWTGLLLPKQVVAYSPSRYVCPDLGSDLLTGLRTGPHRRHGPAHEKEVTSLQGGTQFHLRGFKLFCSLSHSTEAASSINQERTPGDQIFGRWNPLEYTHLHHTFPISNCA